MVSPDASPYGLQLGTQGGTNGIPPAPAHRHLFKRRSAGGLHLMSTRSGFGGALRTSKRRAITSTFAVLVLFGYVLGQGSLVAHATDAGGPSLTMGKVSSGSTSTATS